MKKTILILISLISFSTTANAWERVGRTSRVNYGKLYVRVDTGTNDADNLEMYLENDKVHIKNYLDVIYEDILVELVLDDPSKLEGYRIDIEMNREFWVNMIYDRWTKRQKEGKTLRSIQKDSIFERKIEWNKTGDMDWEIFATHTKIKSLLPEEIEEYLRQKEEDENTPFLSYELKMTIEIMIDGEWINPIAGVDKNMYGDHQITEIKSDGCLAPTTFTLSQNYPNPFNPTTTISYTLPKDNQVTLKVFDALGREMATLVEEYQTAGTHHAQFNANELSSGIYYYQLITNNRVETREMTLIK